MDSTATILEKMDGTAFEQFCGPVLRKMEPELANFLPSGINEAGKTINSLMDGLCFTSSHHMSTAHITTTQEKDLVTKWLYDGDAPTIIKGDLIKGINQAREIHAQSPDFQFTIFLVYNRRVNDTLHIKVQQRNTDSFITVKIIEQRDLVHFLDLEPEGQYLRQKLLNIDADRISPSLLKEIAETNLSRYAKEIFLEEHHLANISGLERVEQLLSATANRINLLTGESGSGKSTLCFAILCAAIERGETVLRISPSAIEKAVSVEDAVLQQLLIDYPKLYIQPRDIPLLFENGRVIFDDINKSLHATLLLDKIISWGEYKNDNSFIVVCPVWPRNLSTLDNDTKKENKYTTISPGRLSFYDCRQIIERRISSGLFALTDQQIHSIIIDTGFDPLLLDFSLQQLSKQNHFSDSVAADAVDQFVKSKIQSTHQLSQEPVYLISKTLVLFGNEMLKNRNLNPHLDDIEGWLGKGTEEYKTICIIAAQRQLFSFSDDGNCYFRHDRVLEHLLMLSAIELLNDFSTNEGVLGDPYYAEIVGAALARKKISKNSLEILINANPLAVYCSLKYVQDLPAEAGLTQTIEVCESWASSIAIRNVPKAVTDTIANVLIYFDTKEIQKVTKGFPRSAELDLAKFRNGIWLSGIQFLSFMGYFYPESPNYWWHSVMAHVKVKYLDKIIPDLQSMLPEKFAPEAICPAYILAGFFRQPVLITSLVMNWKKHSSPENYISYLWAVLNCFTIHDREIVALALSYFNTLTKDEKYRPQNIKSPVSSAVQQIETVSWDFSEEQLGVLLSLSDDPNLHEVLAHLFAHTDHPGALAIVLNKEMQRDETDYLHNQRDERWDLSKKSPKLSEASRAYLLQEYADPANHLIRRYVAWRFWTGNVETKTVLKKMREFNLEQDPLFYHAVLWRIHHYDQTAFNALKTFIPLKPWLVRTLDDIWNNETAEFFGAWFDLRVANKNKQEIEYGLELMAMLDNDFAIQQLIRHWEQLKCYVRAINLALFFSRPETVALADIEIKRLGFVPGEPMPDFYYGNMRGTYWSTGDGLSEEKKADLLLLSELFKRLEWHYGIRYAGKSERLTREKIETLLPYLELMDSFTLHEFAIRCLKIDAPDLCYEKFYPLLNRNDQKRIRLSADDIKRDLVDMLRQVEKENTFYFSRWVYNIDKQKLSNEMLREAIQSFLQEHQNAKAFFVVASVLERLGTRKDVEIMEAFVPDNDANKSSVDNLKANASFLIKRRSLQ